jgi:hypothetical protein
MYYSGSYQDAPFTIASVLTADECKAQIERAESVGFDDAPITTSRGFVRMTEVRNNTRVMWDDVELAQSLFKRVKDRMPSVAGRTLVGLNERFRLYRYEVGQYFKIHADGCFRRNDQEESFYTFMVYLNDGFNGGETKFMHETVHPQRGMGLVFAHPLLHEGASLTRGRKYVLRSDVMYARNPKT